MKRSITRWTTALAAAACLATPTLGWSQTPATQQQSPTAQQPSANAGQPSSEASEHIRQAQAALKDIPATVPARAKSRIAEVKRHLSNLEKSADSSHAQPGAPAQGSKTTARGKSNWSTEVAAIDKILTELLGSASTSGATEPGGSKARSDATLTLDEPTKSKLMEVRTHVTAFAAAMSGTSGAPTGTPSPSEPATTDPAAAAATQPQPTQPATQQPTTQPQPTQPAQPTGQPPATQNPMGAEQPAAPAGQQPDPQASKRHLTAARESLSQLTQLPAAAQLSGEPRTQVSQLITNFNELITTKENWRESYDKVAVNLTALLGPEGAEQPQPQAQTSSTPGAVGTSGTTAASIDPAIRAKLVEFRTHLKQFEQAAGGGGGSQQPADAAGNQPAAGPSPSSTPAATQPPAATTGATSPTPTEQQSASAMGQDNAVQHIDAIEAILSGRSGATTGNAPAATAGATTGNITLTQSQVEEIRMHLTEIRKAVKK